MSNTEKLISNANEHMRKLQEENISLREKNITLEEENAKLKSRLKYSGFEALLKTKLCGKRERCFCDATDGTNYCIHVVSIGCAYYCMKTEEDVYAYFTQSQYHFLMTRKHNAMMEEERKND